MSLSGSDYDYDDYPGVIMPIEDPNEIFYVKNKEKNCKWLARLPLKKRSNLCMMNEAPEGYLNAHEACPSVCCLRPENPDDSFLASPKQVQSCEWLAKLKNEDKLKKICRFTKVAEDVGPAFLACPETCGLCPSTNM